ncbi:YceD family protein [Malonomonas rubra]|nr:DUF177 domain-containing protein [Malonomonas rubra]
MSDFPVLREMLGEGVDITAPLQFELRFQQSGQLVELDGKFSTSVELGCGRCLKRYTADLASEFALTFTPFVEEQEGNEEEEEVELETDELGLVYYRDDCLDLLHPLQDQVVMALPISPLCSDECAGLCSECGCNLNETQCGCEKKIFNNKFSALAGLKIDSNQD